VSLRAHGHVKAHAVGLTYGLHSRTNKVEAANALCESNKTESLRLLLHSATGIDRCQDAQGQKHVSEQSSGALLQAGQSYDITTCCMAAQRHSLCPAARAPSKISDCQIGLTHPAGTTSFQLGTAFLSFGTCLAMRMGHDVCSCTRRVICVCITYSGCILHSKGQQDS